MFLTKCYRSIMFFSKHSLCYVALMLGITLAYGSISGCGKADGPVTPTETEGVSTETVVVEPTVRVNENFDGESIYFELGGTTYEGRVVEGVSADEVRVSLADGNEKVINVDRIAGTLLDDAPDIGRWVVMWGGELGITFFGAGKQRARSEMWGQIVSAYSDGMRKIRLRFEYLVWDRGGLGVDAGEEMGGGRGIVVEPIQFKNKNENPRRYISLLEYDNISKERGWISPANRNDDFVGAWFKKFE